MGKSLFFVTKCNEGRKPGHGRGSAPYRHSDSINHLWAMSKTGPFKTMRLRAARSLVTLFLFKRNSLSNVAGTPRTACWTLALRSAETLSRRIKDCVNAVTSQNQQRNDDFIKTAESASKSLRDSQHGSPMTSRNASQ